MLVPHIKSKSSLFFVFLKLFAFNLQLLNKLIEKSNDDDTFFHINLHKIFNNRKVAKFVSFL